MRAAPIVLFGASLVLGVGVVQSAPEDDLRAFQSFYKQRFPDTPFEDFANGIYSIDESRREEWEQMEEFPQYEFDIDAGGGAVSRTVRQRHEHGGLLSGLRVGRPAELSVLGLGAWRGRHDGVGDQPVPARSTARSRSSTTGGRLHKSPPIWRICRVEKIIDVEVPAADPRAFAAYEDGKRFYYSKRGQLNFSCASCHVAAVGKLLRAELLGPAVGQVSHFPVYRKTWGEITTLHRSYAACNRQLRAASAKPQSRVYRNLRVLPHLHEQRNSRSTGPGARH